jgi:beta-mannosidase
MVPQRPAARGGLGADRFGWLKCVRLLDRGLDGLLALLVNDAAEPLNAELELVVLAPNSKHFSSASIPVRVPPHSSIEVPVEQTFGHFVDSTYSYRFGPPRHEAIVARLRTADTVLSEDVHRTTPMVASPTSGLNARVETNGADQLCLHLSCDCVLYDVRIEVRDFRAADNHFCLTPGNVRTVSLSRVTDSRQGVRGYVDALNLIEPMRLTLPA